jgi:hypothetical protein
MPITDQTRIVIDITFGTGPVVIVADGGAPATRQPERDLVREILMKALTAVEDGSRSIPVNDDHGTIVRDLSFPVPPLPSIFDEPSARGVTVKTAALRAPAAPASPAKLKPKASAGVKAKAKSKPKANAGAKAKAKSKPKANAGAKAKAKSRPKAK